MTLFARSFLLIALLIVTAVLASAQIYRVYEREPRSRELAQQTVSAVNLTRAALLSADPERRRHGRRVRRAAQKRARRPSLVRGAARRSVSCAGDVTGMRAPRGVGASNFCNNPLPDG